MAAVVNLDRLSKPRIIFHKNENERPMIFTVTNILKLFFALSLLRILLQFPAPVGGVQIRNELKGKY